MDNPNFTNGAWAVEENAEAAFVDLAGRSGAFHAYRQVWGEPIYKRPGMTYQRVRCDVLLCPAKPLVDLGWRGGAIVVEVKRNGLALGRPVSQLLDYMNAAFEIPCSGVNVLPNYGFVFSAPKQQGPLASVMAQNRIGTCYLCKWSSKIRFFCGSVLVLELADSAIEIHKLDFGKAIGSR